MIRTLWRPLMLALTVLTTLPTQRPTASNPDDAGRAPLTFPLVGLLLGVLLIGASWALFDLPPLAGAAIVLTLWTVLTGARHLDGLAGCADHLLGGHADGEGRPTIVRDRPVGREAVVVLVLVLIGKFAGVAAALEHGDLLSLLLAPVLGRTAVLALMCALPYVGPAGMAQAFAAHLPRQAGWLVVAVLTGLALILAPAAVLIGAPVAWLIGHGARRRLGGATGDVYGAAIELLETAVLLALALPTGE